MFKHSQIFSPVFFTALILFGLSNFFGLHITSEVSHLDDIGFVLLGLCGVLHTRGYRHGSDLLASLVIFVGLYSLYLWLGLYFTVETKITLDQSIVFGAGSPTPSFCIVLIAYGLAILLSRNSKQKYLWFGVFGSFIASIGAVSLIDSVFEVKSVYNLIEVNKVSIYTAICFFGIGLNLIIDALNQGAEFRSYWIHWGMWILGIFLTLYTSQAIRSHDLMQLSSLGISQSYRNDVLILLFGFVSTTSLSVFLRLSVQESTLQKKIFYDYVPIVILGVATLLATSVYFFLHSNFRTSIHKKFQSDFKSQTGRLTQGLQKYSEVLYTIKDVFDVSNLVERDEFQLVAQRNIDRLPGIYGLGWIEKISNFNQSKYEKSISDELERPFFLFHRLASGDVKRLASPKSAYPILYMEPSVENRSLIGLDMLSYENFVNVIQDHNKSDILTASNKFSFFRDNELKHGMLNLLRVGKTQANSQGVSQHKQNGFAFSLINIEQAVESILFSFENELGINLQFHEMDTSNVKDDSLFTYEPSTTYQSHHWGGFTVAIDDSLERTVEIDFADTKWMVTATPSNSVNYPIWEPSNLFLPIGIFILSCFVALISKKRNRDIQRLKSLQKDLEASMIEAQQSSQSKSDFLANMSHEIRTPMNGIIGMSHLALQTRLSPKQRNYISRVHDSGQSLLEIINDILDFSKIEAGKLGIEKTTFSLEKVIQNFINLVGLRSEENGLNLIVDIDQDVPSNLIGDPLRLGQILINLGVNAAKFTKVGDILLKISVKVKQDDKLTLLFSISDSGIGMSQEQVGRLFESFTQADSSTTRKFGGTGLGLVISKRLCTLMNGEIWVESVLNKGSIFSFTADFGLDLDNDLEKIKMPQELLDGKSLVVCSKKVQSQVIVTNLHCHGVDVVSVASIGEAKDVLKTSQKPTGFTHLFIDWQTSDGCAIEFIQSLDADKNIASMKSMLISTVYSKPKLFELAHDLHYEIDGTIGSPMTPDSLLLDISKCLSDIDETKSPSNQAKDLDDATMSQLTGSKILLVEDNKVNQFLAVALLKKANLLVTVVENGKLAVEKLDEEDFDGVLMDIQMPEMDGYTATKIIRQKAKHKDLPIIAMTANVMESDVEKIYAVGMNDYIGKPLDIKGMYLTIAKYINKS